jgi:hypothetical protein
MSSFDGSSEPGTETHEYPADRVKRTPTPEGLRDIAWLLEIEPDDGQIKKSGDSRAMAPGVIADRREDVYL